MFDEIVSRWKRANPLTCHSLGIHDYDGQLPDYSESFISKRITEIKADIESLITQKKPSGKLVKFDHGLILSALKRELFELDERKEFKDNPLIWIRPFTLAETSYTARNFASLDDRIRILIEFEKGIPKFLQQAFEVLNPSIPLAKIEMGIGFLSGIISFYKDKLIGFITETDSEKLIDDWSIANIEAVEAMENFHMELKNKYQVNAHDDFALGEEKFLKLLEKTEGVIIDLDQLLIIGEDDLEKNYQALIEIGKNLPDGDLSSYLEEIRNDVPEPDKLVSEAESTLDRTKQFLIDSSIVSMPTDEQTTVIATPEYARNFAFAAMNTPGPFEVPEASESYYWITPPDLTWPENKIKQFMSFFNKSFLEIVTIHEVWPGHYLQLLYNRQSKSEISKMFARSITMIEGWSHYCEQMVYDEGYAPFDRVKLHVGQLFGALIRNVRYISAIKMHCRGMTIEESKKLFMEKAFLPEPNADIEANRGTVNPMYLNYTLGKLLILKLREDYQKEKGELYSLRKFHDEILSYASPPITVLREILLEHPGSMQDIL